MLRLRGHAAYDTCNYLAPGEAESFQAADPVPRYRAELCKYGLEERVRAIESELNNFLEACIQRALAQPRPSPEGMQDDLFGPKAPRSRGKPPPLPPSP